MNDPLEDLDPDLPVLIAGPTATGKSALAMRIAEARGGPIVNADALQVFSNWRLLTARPTVEDEARIPHHLYGQVPGHRRYSVGDWLREMKALLDTCERPVIVGGTGLYFNALTEGLADIPETPDVVRHEALARIARGHLSQLLDEIDAETRARIDRLNPMRVQRAWEVQATTGKGLAAWQDETPAPLLPLSRVRALLIEADRDWTAQRIALRFRRMVSEGVLDEARQNLPGWDPETPSSKAIGAAELIAHLQGDISLDQAIERAVAATRQYAKRQRSWFRARMGDWTRLKLPTP